jgi:hypothetical protein
MDIMESHHIYPKKYYKSKDTIKLSPDDHTKLHKIIDTGKKEDDIFYLSALLSFLYRKFSFIFKS